MSELQTLDLVSFVGGLNKRASPFQLGPQESPDMLNIEIDPRGGFYTRKGWQRWNHADITDPTTWRPRSSEAISLSDGELQVYVANGSTIYAAARNAAFVDLQIPVGGSAHLADYASWGDTVYIACGVHHASYKRVDVEPAVPIAAAGGAGAWNDDYTMIDNGVIPQSEFIEPHSGYLFTAFTREGSSTHRDRIRWSHPNQPEDWHSQDYIDIKTGGGEITGLMSFRDHLLIFKTDSLWALYGYNSESWQLIKVSRSIGAPAPNAITRSENAVYFYSAAGHSSIYAYSGEAPVEISHQLDPVMEEITQPEDVWLGWVGRRLWCSLPWNEAAVAHEGSQFVFDPHTGNGAWVRHRPALGEVTCIVEGSDTGTDPPLACLSGTSGAACLVKLDALEGASDELLAAHPPNPFGAYYRTGWNFADQPERRKSWRRPRLVMRRESQHVEVDLDTYWNYDSAAAKRRHLLDVKLAHDVAVWSIAGSTAPPGIDWGQPGQVWKAAGGDLIERAQPAREGGRGGLGVARAVQLRFSTSNITPGLPWGVDAVVLKYINRRMTT